MDAQYTPTDKQIVDEILFPISDDPLSPKPIMALRYRGKNYFYEDGVYTADPGGKKIKQLILYRFGDWTKTVKDQKRVYGMLFNHPRFEITDDELSQYQIEGVNYFNNDDDLIRAEDVQIEHAEFIYKPYFPKGKLTVVGAYPGTGKTMLMSYFAARITRGQSFFGCYADGVHNVLYFSSEDGIEDTLKVRFDQAEGDATKQSYYRGIITFSDTYRICNLIDKTGADVLIFDPLQSYASTADLNNATLTRQMFDVLDKVSRDKKITIIIVCHFNKNSKGDAITRIIGSTDIVGKARSFIALGNMPGDDGRKFFSHEKSNLARAGLTQIFRIDPDNGLIIPDGTTTKRYDNLMRDKPVLHDDKLEAAKNLILKNVDEDGAIWAENAYRFARDENISDSTIKTARRDLNMSVTRIGYPGKSIWRLPDPVTGDDLADLKRPP